MSMFPNPTRRALLATGLVMPFALMAAEGDGNSEVANLWRRLFTGPLGETICWWYQGTLYAHVDRLREFPVVGLHAIMVARASEQGNGLALDYRTIGCFSDLDSGEPVRRWRNPFTNRVEDIPPFFIEGPGRYVMTPSVEGVALTLTAAQTRTNRIVATMETSGERVMLTQIEGTLQGFPALDGKLPPLDSPAVTERQTRIQLITQRAALAKAEPVADVRGFFSHVYDALPPWLGFGEALGSGLSKGQMRKARTDEIVNRAVWAYLKRQVPSAFSGNRLVLP